MMRVIIEKKDGTLKEYTKLRKLSYAPGANLVNDRLALDEMSCEIRTSVNFKEGAKVWLKDNNDYTWFHGRLTYAKTENEGINLKIKARTELLYLDKKSIKATYYNNVAVKTAIKEVFQGTQAEVLFKEDAVANKKITGFCPKQTRRERLQQILFATGLYCRTARVEHPTITTYDLGMQAFGLAGDTAIPKERTYYKPHLTYQDHVTAITVTSFSFAQRAPTSGEETVEADGVTYVVTRTDVTYKNNGIPSTAPPNEIEYSNVMLIGSSNVDAVLNTLAAYYFDRTRLEFDCINNGKYWPGRRYTVCLGGNQWAEGVVDSVDFTFSSNYAKAKMSMGCLALMDTYTLEVVYRSKDNPPGSGVEIARREYDFPAGYRYEIDSEYIGITMGDWWYLFRPTVSTIKGTMGYDEEVKYVDCRIALKKNKTTGILYIVSVDSVTRKLIESGDTSYYQAEIE